MQLQVDKLAKNLRRGEPEKFLQLFPACLAACRQLLLTLPPPPRSTHPVCKANFCMLNFLANVWSKHQQLHTGRIRDRVTQVQNSLQNCRWKKKSFESGAKNCRKVLENCILLYCKLAGRQQTSTNLAPMIPTFAARVNSVIII